MRSSASTGVTPPKVPSEHQNLTVQMDMRRYGSTLMTARGDLPRRALLLVEEAGFQAVLIGGWSRELIGLDPPWDHSDIDLMVTDADIEALDAWLTTRNEIVLKRFPHKRAFLLDNVMVELHLLCRRTDPDSH
jgi:hypothetical protein